MSHAFSGMEFHTDMRSITRNASARVSQAQNLGTGLPLQVLYTREGATDLSVAMATDGLILFCSCAVHDDPQIISVRQK